MAKEAYDVVVVGADPAGCMVAYIIGKSREALLVGVKKTLNLSWVLNILSGVFIFLITLGGMLPTIGYLLVLVVPYTGYNIIKIVDKKTDKNFLCGVVVDGEYVLLCLLALLGKNILP